MLADEIRKGFSVERLFAERPKLKDFIINCCKTSGEARIYGKFPVEDNRVNYILPQYTKALADWAKSEGFSVSNIIEYNGTHVVTIWI